MKSKLILFLSIVIFIGCKNQVSLSDGLKYDGNWYDEYGNMYCFENEIVKTKSIFGDRWWEIGSFKVKKDSLIITCGEDARKTYKLALQSISEDYITFNSHLNNCEFNPLKTKVNKGFSIWKIIGSVIDEKEKLISLTLKVEPYGMRSGPKVCRIKNDHTIELGFKNTNTIDTSFILDSNTYQNIEKLIQILPFEEYKNSYDFLVFDGIICEIDLITSKVNKKISCNGRLIFGIVNLKEELDYQLLSYLKNRY
jgi:hypothetical protein